jgi:hypothetical protein
MVTEDGATVMTSLPNSTPIEGEVLVRIQFTTFLEGEVEVEGCDVDSNSPNPILNFVGWFPVGNNTMTMSSSPTSRPRASGITRKSISLQEKNQIFQPAKELTSGISILTIMM